VFFISRLSFWKLGAVCFPKCSFLVVGVATLCTTQPSLLVKLPRYSRSIHQCSSLLTTKYKRYRGIRGAAKSYWARSVRSSDRTTLTSGSQAAVFSSRQSATDECFLPRTSKKNCCVYAFVSVNLRLICALLASSSHHHRSSTIADTLEAAARRANVEVVSGAKVIGVDDTERSESIEEVAANLNANKRFTVTYQSSSSGAGAAGDDRKGGKVLKGKRSSLYEGLESLSDVDVDYQESLEGVDRAATADGTAVTSRREKVTDSIVCDRVIMATGSSRLGYDIVRGLGHSMHDPLPSLFSFKIPVSLCACLNYLFPSAGFLYLFFFVLFFS